MSKSIKNRENEEYSLQMLGAQRKLYDDAKTADSINILLSVLFPFVLSFILLFVPGDSVIGTLSYIVSLLGLIVSFVVEKSIKHKKELAANIQQQFDVYVYNMPWNKRLFGKKKNLDHEIVKYSKKLFQKRGEKEKLLNWYPEPANNMSAEESIIICQRENCWWDEELRKRYKCISIIIVIALTVIIFLIGIIKNETVVKLLWRAAFFVPMIKWLSGTIHSLDDDLKRLNDLKEALDSLNCYQMKELQKVQKLIFEHRKNCLPIPNLIYRFYKNNDEEIAHEIIEGKTVV